MKNKFNYIEISGRVVTIPKVKRGYLIFSISSRRKSGTCDIIMVCVKTSDVGFKIKMGSNVHVKGSIAGKLKNVRYYDVVAEDIEKCPSLPVDVNKVIISGKLSEDANKRQTCTSNQDASDLEIDCTSLTGSKDHFYCVAFDESARLVEGVKAQSCVTITGRLQSRESNYGTENELVATTMYLVDETRLAEEFEMEKQLLDKEKRTEEFFAGKLEKA